MAGVSSASDRRQQPSVPAEPAASQAPAPDAAGPADEQPGAAVPPPAAAEPGPPQKPPRSVLSVRDVLVAMGLLIVVALFFARSCSFSPGGPTVAPDSAPTVDAVAALQAAAPRTPFPLRVPALPAGWRANSSDESAVAGDGRAVRVGYLTASGTYLRLVQSDAAEEDLVATENGGPLAATGTVDAAGLTWVAYTRASREAIWVATEPGPPQTRLLLTGSAAEPDFRALAQATVEGERLPAGRPPS